MLLTSRSTRRCLFGTLGWSRLHEPPCELSSDVLSSKEGGIWAQGVSGKGRESFVCASMSDVVVRCAHGAFPPS